MKQRVRAAMLLGEGRIELIEQELPSVLPGRVRLSVLQCGLCTGEVDQWTGRATAEGEEDSAGLGHEVAGVVEEVGAGVEALRPGDVVAAWVEGGGMAEGVVVPADHCITVPGEVRYPALAEPLGCVVNSVELAAPALGDDVIILGAGFMGNLVQLVMTLKGPASLTVADLRADALDRAVRLATIPIRTASPDQLVAAREGQGEGAGGDVTFEVTGAQEGLDIAGGITRMNGKIVIVGYHQGVRRVDLGHWNWMAFRLLNAHFRDLSTILRGMRAGIRLMSAGVLDLSPLVSHTFPLEDVSEAFEVAANHPPGFTKAVLVPRASSVI